jgi:hypothetical protein
MLELRHEIDLSEEPIATQDECDFGAKNLQRHRAVMFVITGEKDERNTAATELTLNREASGQGLSQASHRVANHGSVDPLVLLGRLHNPRHPSVIFR